MSYDLPGSSSGDPGLWWAAPASARVPTESSWARPDFPETRPLPTAALPGADVPVTPAGSAAAWTDRSRTVGAGFALAGLLAGGLLGARAHDAVTGGANDPTGTVAAPASPRPSATPTLPAPTNPTPDGGAGPSTPPSTGPTAVPPAVPTGPTGPTAGIAARVTPSVVDIYTTVPAGAGAGTGMVLTAGGDVLTNNHVIEGATSLRVVLVTTGRSYAAKVVGTDPTDDVAVLHLTGAAGLHPISAANSAAVGIGDRVVALGNAGGRGGAPSVVSGSVIATNRSITVSDSTGSSSERLTGLIETDAPIEPGDSGGPLADTDAKVIGMDTAASVSGRFDGATSEGYAIPINRALSIARQITAGKGSSTVHIGVPGLLGVSVLPSTGSAPGAQVNEVTAGSPAATVGLAPGDTITTVDAKIVSSATELPTLIRSHRPGDAVRIGWTDGAGSRHTATVRLAAGPPD